MASEHNGTSAPTNTINQNYAHGRHETRSSKSDKSWILFCGLFSVVGAIMLVVNITALVNEIQLRRDCTELTDGIVTQLVLNPADESDEDSSDTWTPVFRYSADGQTYEQKFSISSSPPQYKVGQAVTILYDPANPSRYVVKGDNSALLLHFLLMLMCICFTAVLPIAAVIHKINNPSSKASQQLSY
ncbi:DUF3592 domain-containing protein [Bifidobacterium felsineum]|uniref:DUF3592 domain-containing protein n=1 Tax=Bifidobacterium felsineum TaxID=2045440 RepID=A0A2M9HKT0_9BIFI|nr:DUF3592 domain-containing protein [Bifidobacterium felsineum]MBT1163589.1 DUF3592 domain-containing protein [Bifidobacterium felsineum]PJM77381.1 hypothetical protein CSQ86_05740 [Bifidobacterium felsineum]